MSGKEFYTSYRPGNEGGFGNNSTVSTIFANPIRRDFGKKELPEVFVSSLKNQKGLQRFMHDRRSLDDLLDESSTECLPGFKLELDKLSKDESVKVLDLGCGKGEAVRELQERYQNWQIHGVDLLPKDDGYKTGNIVGGEAAHLPYKSNTFNLVYSKYAYTYFPDKIEAVRKAVLATKPGGVVIMQVSPGNVYEQVEASRVEGFKGKKVVVFREGNGGDQKFFKRVSVIKELRAVGINVENSRHSDANIRIQKSLGDDKRVKSLPFKLINKTSSPDIVRVNSYYIREPLVGKSIA
ncbi:class I SAM-dependent methyltransferase [Patescibacteria group bacterium]|nr:class I SAM-dependent methyltransferase [Patescibacteria group bacterium]